MARDEGKGRGWRWAWILLPLGFLFVMALFYPFRYVFEFDRDEGINAIKALLILRGFRLYTDIWNDQPPVFTLLLTLWFRIFGLRVVAGRILVLLFSTLLVGAGAWFLRRWWGTAAAVIGALFVVLLPLYLELSVSIMIGLPAIALATLSFVTLCVWHESRRSFPLLLSSALLALSVFSKAFTAILVPIWIAGVVLAIRAEGTPGGRLRQPWSPLALWILVFVAISVVVTLWAVGPSHVGQLIQVHFAAETLPAFRASDSLPAINVHLLKVLPVILLAIVGTVEAYRRKRWTTLYLTAWTVAAYALLIVHRPTWPHQQLLVTVPAAILAGAAAGEAVDAVLRLRRAPARHFSVKSLQGVVAITAVWALGTLAPTALRQFNADWPNLKPTPWLHDQERQIVATLWNHAAETEWIFTDRPMFAFLTNLKVPPEVAVLSRKRLLTGDVTPSEILSILETYQPEMILKGGRFDLPVVDEYMRRRDYRRIDATSRFRLYLRHEED